MTSHRVEGHGGVGLHVHECGNPDGAPIVLIHGWSQHHLSWSKQFRGPLAERFRLIAPDLRGHGASDKPDAPESYGSSEPWAGDIAAIIETLGLEQPLLVGWSMGGRVIGDYLTVMGDAAISGVVMIGSAATGGASSDPAAMALRKPDAQALGAYATDQSVEIAAIIDFVKACSAAPLSKKDLAMMVGLNMLCPPTVRKACRVRDYDHRPAYGAMTKPAMVIQGAAEKLCVEPLFREMVESLPDPLVHVYPGNGHMAFWESPDRFDTDLGRFADDVMGARP